MQRFTVDDTTVGERLDNFVTKQLNQVSRSFIHKLSDDGHIKLNNGYAKPGYKLRMNDVVTVNYDFTTLTDIPDIELPVIYEDDDCVVINKPPGVLTHSKGALNPEGTVATFMGRHVKGLEGERAGIVHRLDRATSGVIICAKNPTALAWLQKQFSQRKVKKTYVAITEGHLQPTEAIIDMPIERNPKRPQTFRVGNNGRPATTLYRVMDSGRLNDLVELKPTTGRTHQLRVHLKHLGHPIVGDALYGNIDADRLFLHALSLELTLPSRERKVFTVELPAGFKEYVHAE